jgi:hypothetical protein
LVENYLVNIIKKYIYEYAALPFPSIASWRHHPSQNWPWWEAKNPPLTSTMADI